MALKLSYVLLCTLFVLGKLSSHFANGVYFEDVNVHYINEDYVDQDTFDVSINYLPNGHNVFSVRTDIIKDLPKDIMAAMNMSTRSFGHDIPFGVSMKGKICDSNELLPYYSLIVMIPFGITDCPPPKGTYELENYEPDLTIIKLPALIKAKLLIDFELFTEEEKIISMKVFLNF